MKIIIHGDPKEIAALVLDIQERRQCEELNDWMEEYLNHRSSANRFRSECEGKKP